MDLSNRHYSKQSHMLVNAKYALTKNEIDLILTLLTEIKEDDKDFQDLCFYPFQRILGNFKFLLKPNWATSLKAGLKKDYLVKKGFGLEAKGLNLEDSKRNYLIKLGEGIIKNLGFPLTFKIIDSIGGLIPLWLGIWLGD